MATQYNIFQLCHSTQIIDCAGGNFYYYCILLSSVFLELSSLLTDDIVVVDVLRQKIKVWCEGEDLLAV